MGDQSKESRFLAEVTMALIQAAAGGAGGGGREVSERFRLLAKGCLALRYKRLYWILDALATRLAKPRPETCSRTPATRARRSRACREGPSRTPASSRTSSGPTTAAPLAR
jgi:hypothetical protein